MYRLHLSQAKKAWRLVWKPRKKLRTGPFSKRSNWSTSDWIVLFEAVFNACKPSFISHLPVAILSCLYLPTLWNTGKQQQSSRNEAQPNKMHDSKIKLLNLLRDYEIWEENSYTLRSPESLPTRCGLWHMIIWEGISSPFLQYPRFFGTPKMAPLWQL